MLDRTGIATTTTQAAFGRRIEIVRDRKRFDELEGAWNDLFERVGRAQNVFQTYNWLWHWANHYLDGSRRLAIVLGWNGDTLEMIWPLVISGRAPFRRLCWMGEPVSQYGDVIIAESIDHRDWLHTGWNAVRKLGADVAHLRKVRDDSIASRILFVSGVGVASRDQAPFLALASARDFAAYEKRYPSKTRSSRRRYLRRLQGEGEVTFAACGASPQGRDLARTAIRHKKDWVRNHGVIAPALMDPRFENFFADVADGQTHPVPMRVAAVECNGTPVGIELSFACGDRLFGHVISHHPDFEKKGAGSVLAEYAVKAAHEGGYAIYDLLAPADPYKSEWADGHMGVRDWAAPLSLAGILYTRLWLCGLRPRVKHALDNAPKGLGKIGALLLGGTRLRPASRDACSQNA